MGRAHISGSRLGEERLLRLKYSPQLDGLRALAIVMVFSHHAFHVPLFWSGVDLFFILSGYLITNLLVRDCERMSFKAMLGRFYTRRAERILPAYVLALLLLYPLDRVEFGHLWGYYVFFLQNVPYAFHVMGMSPLLPLWSLAVEQHFYLIWPVVVYFLPKRWLAPCMIGIIVASPVLRAVCTPLFAYPETVYAFTPFRLDDMAAGALAALWLPRCRPRVTIRWAQAGMVVGVVAYAVLAVHPWFRRGANTAAFNSLAYSLNLLILGGLFVWVALSDGAERADGRRGSLLARGLSHPLLRGLGRISYMFYLLHLGALMLASRYFGTVAAAVVAFAGTTAAATLSWFAVEKPVLSLSASHRRAVPQVAGTGS